MALLCDVAELAEDIDVERAKASLDTANDLASDPSNADAEAAIHRAEVRLEASAGI